MSQFIEMFKGDYQTEKWEDCLSITNGKKYDGDYQEYGSFPICGSGGIMGYGESKFCDKDTVILGRKGNINSPIYMKNDYWIVDTAFSLAVDRQKLQPKYFYFWCKRFDFTKYNKQGVLPSLTKNDLQKIEIPIPPMELQTSFVVMLDQADKSEFDGFKSQFIEMFGNPVTNDKEWSTLPISEVAPESPSDDKQTGEVWLLNLDMIERNTGKVINKVMEDESNLLSVSPFDEDNVLFSKLRPYLNKVVIPDGKGYATTELIPLRPNPKLLNKVFFSHLLRNDVFVKYANSISTGTKMPRMPIGDLRKFRCILPPLSLQERFVSIAEQADKSENRSELKQAS